MREQSQGPLLAEFGHHIFGGLRRALIEHSDARQIKAAGIIHCSNTFRSLFVKLARDSRKLIG
jgi:hypothetical protein